MEAGGISSEVHKKEPNVYWIVQGDKEMLHWVIVLQFFGTRRVLDLELLMIQLFEYCLQNVVLMIGMKKVKHFLIYHNLY